MEQKEEFKRDSFQKGNIDLKEILGGEAEQSNSEVVIPIEGTIKSTSRTIQLGIAALIFQFLALVFFIGQFYQKQESNSELMARVTQQHEQMVTDLAVIKSGQMEQDRRLNILEETERREEHPIRKAPQNDPYAYP